jgi:hypothetical protein
MDCGSTSVWVSFLGAGAPHGGKVRPAPNGTRSFAVLRQSTARECERRMLLARWIVGQACIYETGEYRFHRKLMAPPAAIEGTVRADLFRLLTAGFARK